MENPGPSWRPLKRLVAAIFIISLPVLYLLFITVCSFFVRYLVENDPFIVNEVEISYSGQINGEFEAQGGIVCNDRNKVPFLSFLASEEDDFSWVAIDLTPYITTGTYQFTGGGVEGSDILFHGTVYAENDLLLRPEDLVSGDLTLTKLPDRKGGMVEGEFSVVYPNMTVEGTFKFDADSNDAPFDCIK